jgi:purine-nucleoside phosphorylase
MNASEDAPDLQTQIDDAVSYLKDRWDRSPKFGIILGTGAGEVANAIEAEAEIPYGDVPYFPSSTAIGHKGQFVCGKLVGKDVIAMQGRFHLYEGYPVDQSTLPIHVMHAMGVEVLFVSNASGGINPNYRSGQIMLIQSHIDLMCRLTPAMAPKTVHHRPLLRSDTYDVRLIEEAVATATSNGFTVQQGVYAAMLGPNYETRAEYRFLQKVGGDVAGMSTVPEVTVAGKYGMRVLGMSIVSNVANPDALQSTSGQEVIDAAAIAAPQLRKIVEDAMRRN